MRIGVDAGPLRHTPTGIGWYLFHTLEHLPDSADGDSFLLYASTHLRSQPRGVLFQSRVGRSPLPGSLWLQTTGLAMMRRDKLDCFWGPAHLMPLYLPRTVRKVLTVHDLVWMIYPQSMARYNALVHSLLFHQSVARADSIIAVSEATKTDLIRLTDADPARVVVIHEGVESAFRPIPPEEVRVRLKAMNIAGDYILAVGTLEPRKNYPTLLEAMARLPEAPPLLIAGRPGWGSRSVLSAIVRNGLEKRVRLLSYVSNEELVTLYCGAKLLIMPSFYEGFGLPVLQAMACGTPVLSSNVSSLPEIAGDAAFYFEPWAAESVASALSTVLSDNGLRDRLRETGLRRAKLFTWHRTATQTLALLHGRPRLDLSPTSPSSG